VTEDWEEGELPDDEAPEEGEEEGLAAVAVALPGQPPTAATSVSRGSANHEKGTCRPCAWMHKTAAGCRNAEFCEYCHLCSPGELKRRKRDKMQRRLAEVAALQQEALQQRVLIPERVAGHTGLAFSVHDVGLAAMEPRYVEVAPNRQSLGSLGHAQGQCRPCAWIHKDAGGCRNGTSCSYCHLCPPGELKRRKREKWEVLRTCLQGLPET